MVAGPIMKKHFLKVAAKKLTETCLGQAWYLLWMYSSSLGENTVTEGQCPYCYQFLVLNKYRVLLKPKPKLTPKVKKVLNRESKNCRLNFKEAKILKKYNDSRNILYICKFPTHLSLNKEQQNKPKNVF
uniref:Uncharacterized protein n=1 Tax=Monodelphis domestica TaxID=13616 RepID=A0A5F8H390_MONDO